MRFAKLIERGSVVMLLSAPDENSLTMTAKDYPKAKLVEIELSEHIALAEALAMAGEDEGG